MAANRKPYCAPDRLLSMSKVTLADALWELASLSPERRDRTRVDSTWVVVQNALQKVKAPAHDMRAARVAREELAES